ncbi:MAG TPA: hypothetical protein VGN05_12660 [Parvibaculum sp.]
MALHSRDARRFFDFWNGMPKTGLLPDRASFNADILHELPTMTILEVISPERIDLHLMGPGACEALGFDPTGQNYLDLQSPEARALYVPLIEEQITRPCGRRNIVKMRHADGIVTRAEAVTLPMHHAAGGHPMILSYFTTIDIVGFEEGGYQVLNFEDTEWIDIGAGIPARR